MTDRPTAVRIDCTTVVDSISFFDEVAVSSLEPRGVAEVVPGNWAGVVHLKSAPAPRLRTYVVLSHNGWESKARIQGHELESTDPETFRIFRFEREQRVCVAAIDRRSTLAVVEADAIGTGGRHAEAAPAEPK